MEATDPCKIGAIGSTPIRSTSLLFNPDRTAGRHCHDAAVVRLVGNKLDSQLVYGKRNQSRMGGWGGNPGDAAGSSSRKWRELLGNWPQPPQIMVTEVYSVGTPACEAGSGSSNLLGYPFDLIV